MENSVIIKDLGKLLEQYLKTEKIIDYTVKNLTAPGDNYGSLMTQVEIKLSDGNVFHVVAKMCPQNKWLKESFNVVVTFKKEIGVYTTIVPTLQSFQKAQGVKEIIDCFPQCYGSRISLDPLSTTVDDDALLLMENLKLSGYEVVDRMKGFDLEMARLVIKDLAIFHAIPIAIKLLKPELFNKNILPHLNNVKAFKNISENAEKSMLNTIIKTANNCEDCIPLLPAVKIALRNCLDNMRSDKLVREPFATINHNDLWVCNNMINFEKGKPVRNKMLDFQLVEYGSPGNDIVFLLFSSVQKAVLDKYYNHLIEHYYKTFINTLTDLKCDTIPFTFQQLQEEIKTSAKDVQFFHVMIMLRPIFALRSSVREQHEISEESLINDDCLSDEYKQKVPEIIMEFAKRGWI